MSEVSLKESERFALLVATLFLFTVFFAILVVSRGEYWGVALPWGAVGALCLYCWWLRRKRTSRQSHYFLRYGQLNHLAKEERDVVARAAGSIQNQSSKGDC